MALRDHFRPPADKAAPWEAVHGGWPMVIVQTLGPKLPSRYVAHPRVHLGAFAAIDVSAYERHVERPDNGADGGAATAVWAPPRPTLSVMTDNDVERGQRLVAAIELVSPANKDRPEHRRAFVAKCATLLQSRVSVTIVDIVTVRTSNLYAEMLEMIGQSDPALGADPPGIYAVACRGTKRDTKPKEPWRLETWLYPLQIGKALPALPLWLGGDVSIPLDLEESYEETCRALRIP